MCCFLHRLDLLLRFFFHTLDLCLYLIFSSFRLLSCLFCRLLCRLQFFLADGALIAETLEFHLGADHLMFQTVCLFFHALFVGCKCLRTLFFFKIIIRQIQISHNTLVVFRHFQKSRLRLELENLPIQIRGNLLYISFRLTAAQAIHFSIN